MPLLLRSFSGAPAEQEGRRVEAADDETAGAHGRVADHPAVYRGGAIECLEKGEGGGEGDREAERDVARKEVEIEEDPEGPQVADGRDEAEDGEHSVRQAVDGVGATWVGYGGGVPQE